MAKPMSFRSVYWAVLSGFLISIAGQLPAMAPPQQDWNQWGGPNRNFRAARLNEAETAPLPKPELVWKRNMGPGHAAIVTGGQFGYSVHLDGENEVVQQWRLDSGEQVWECRYKVSYHAQAEYDGPHATPAIDNDRIIVASIDAQVHAISLSDGKLIWKRDLRADFKTKLPQSGYACSPLVSEGRVFLSALGESQPGETEYYNPNPEEPVGRKAIPGAVALDIETGETAWESETFRTSHSSPIKIDFGDQSMLVFHGMFELIGVDPKDGSTLWRHLLRKLAADNVSFTPIWDPARSQLLISHGYCRFGTQAIKLEKNQGNWKTTANWKNPQLQVVHTNAVLLNSTLVATRRPAATLMVGIDVESGKTVFRQRGFGKSNLLAVGSQVLVLDESGELVHGQLADDGVEQVWKIPVLARKAWTVPTISGRRLILRNGNELKLYRFP